MSAVNDTIEAGGATPPATIKVWDPFIRVFHWSLATLFLVAYATGDEVEQVHVAAGYAIAGLVAARLIWGFIGSRHARFRSFVRPPREVLAYLRDLVSHFPNSRRSLHASLAHAPEFPLLSSLLIATV